MAEKLKIIIQDCEWINKQNEIISNFQYADTLKKVKMIDL